MSPTEDQHRGTIIRQFERTPISQTNEDRLRVVRLILT